MPDGFNRPPKVQRAEAIRVEPVQEQPPQELSIDSKPKTPRKKADAAQQTVILRERLQKRRKVSKRERELMTPEEIKAEDDAQSQNRDARKERAAKHAKTTAWGVAGVAYQSQLGRKAPKEKIKVVARKQLEKLATLKKFEETQIRAVDEGTLTEEQANLNIENARGIWRETVRLEEERAHLSHGGIFSIAYQTGLRGAEEDLSAIANKIRTSLGFSPSKERRPQKSPFESSIKNMLFSTLALFQGLNTADAIRYKTDPLAPQAYAGAPSESGPRMIDGVATVVLSDTAHSPFAELIKERGSLELSNFYFQRPDRGIFRTFSVNENTVATFAPYESLERLWKVKRENQISDGVAANLGSEIFLQRWRDAEARGDLHRSSLDLEMTRSYGLLEGVTSTEAVLKNFDWQRFAEDQSISEENLRLIQALSELITPVMIESIFLTEIMPHSSDGALNAAMYDFVLIYGGRAYVSAIPALGDAYMSVGPSQATTFVTGPNRSTGIMSRYMSPEAFRLLRLPTSYEATDSEEYKTEIAMSPEIILSIAEHRTLTLLNGMWNIVAYTQSGGNAREGLELILEEAENGDRRTALTRLAELLGESHNHSVKTESALRAFAERGDITASLPSFTSDDAIAEYGRRMQGNFPVLYDRYSYLDNPETRRAIREGTVTVAGSSSPANRAR